jgi:hypothetical protein
VGHQSTVMALATALSLVEVGAAAAVLWFRTRGTDLVSGTPARSAAGQGLAEPPVSVRPTR